MPPDDPKNPLALLFGMLPPQMQAIIGTMGSNVMRNPIAGPVARFVGEEISGSLQDPSRLLANLMVPGVPGGPMFRSATALRNQLKHMKTPEIRSLIENVRNSMFRGRQANKLSQTQSLELGVIRGTAEHEYITRTLGSPDPWDIAESWGFVTGVEPEQIIGITGGDKRKLADFVQSELVRSLERTQVDEALLHMLGR